MLARRDGILLIQNSSLSAKRLPLLPQGTSPGPTLSTSANKSSKRYETHDLVTIRVRKGRNTKDYKIPGQLLTWHSSYLAAAADPDDGFGTSGAEELELECSPAVFDTFYCWIYSRTLQLRAHQSRIDTLVKYPRAISGFLPTVAASPV